MEKKLITVKEAAAMLGISRSLLYSLVMQGDMKSVKIGRARRIPIGEIDNFVARELELADGDVRADGSRRGEAYRC